jgi:hypothetical protein
MNSPGEPVVLVQGYGIEAGAVEEMEARIMKVVVPLLALGLANLEAW